MICWLNQFFKLGFKLIFSDSRPSASDGIRINLLLDNLYRITYYVSMIKTLPITKARDELPTLVDKANKQLDEFIITVNGTPAAVLLSAAEYESWKETNEIMGDPSLLQAIKEGERDLKKGNYITFEQLKKELGLHV